MRQSATPPDHKPKDPEKPWWRRAVLALPAIVGATLVGLVVTKTFDWGYDTASVEPAPVVVTVQTASPFETVDTSVVPRPASNLPAPPSIRLPFEDTFDRCVTHGWVRDLNGVDVRSQFVVYLEGRSARPVRIHDIRARVIKRRMPMRGTAVGGCAAFSSQPSLQPSRHLSVDLNPGGTVRYLVPPKSTRGSSVREPFGVVSAPLIFVLQKGEIENFSVDSGGRCWCDWVLDVDYVVAGKHHVVSADNHGHPFSTTSGDRAHHAEWDRRKWLPNRVADKRLQRDRRSCARPHANCDPF